MGTEDWILKGAELITNTKKQRLKIQSRGQILKTTILKKQNKITKVIKNIYMKFALKQRLFCKVIVGFKMKIKGVIKNLNFFNLKLKK